MKFIDFKQSKIVNKEIAFPREYLLEFFSMKDNEITRMVPHLALAKWIPAIFVHTFAAFARKNDRIDTATLGQIFTQFGNNILIGHTAIHDKKTLVVASVAHSECPHMPSCRKVAIITVPANDFVGRLHELQPWMPTEIIMEIPIPYGCNWEKMIDGLSGLVKITRPNTLPGPNDPAMFMVSKLDDDQYETMAKVAINPSIINPPIPINNLSIGDSLTKNAFENAISGLLDLIQAQGDQINKLKAQVAELKKDDAKQSEIKALKCQVENNANTTSRLIGVIEGINTRLSMLGKSRFINL